MARKAFPELTREQVDALLLAQNARVAKLEKAVHNCADALDYCLSVLPRDELLRLKVEATRNAARATFATPHPETAVSP